MASNNPFAEDYDPRLPVQAPVPTAGAPSVPISRGNPFEEGQVVERPPPATLHRQRRRLHSRRPRTPSRWGCATAWRAPTDCRCAARRRVIPQASTRPWPTARCGASAARCFPRPETWLAAPPRRLFPASALPAASISAALGGAGRGVMPNVARVAGYGIEGGLLGAGQAAGQTYSENPADYARNAMTGGAFGTLVGAPFGRFRRRRAAFNGSNPILGTELKASSKNAYDLTHQIPVAYDAPHFWGGLDALEQQLLAKTNPVRSPSVFDTIERARGGRGQVGPGQSSYRQPKNIDDLRQQLTGVAEPGAGQARPLAG